MPQLVYLIGENHIDLFKRPRELTAYQRLKPDIISLEQDEPTSKEDLRYLDDLITKAAKNHDCSKEDFAVQYPLSYNAILSVFGGTDYATREYVKEHPEVKINYTNTIGELYVQNVVERASLRRLENSEEFRLLMRLPHKKRKIATHDILFELLYRSLCGREEYFKKERDLFLDVDLMKKLEERLIERIPKGDFTNHLLILDASYYCDPTPVHSEEYGDLEERDRETVGSVMSLNGIIVHKTGSAHIFGNYNNLYNQLRERNVKVKRFKLNKFSTFNKLSTKAKYNLRVRFFATFAWLLKKILERK